MDARKQVPGLAEVPPKERGIEIRRRAGSLIPVRARWRVRRVGHERLVRVFMSGIVTAEPHPRGHVAVVRMRRAQDPLSSRPMLKPGDTFERYTIEAPLGQGGTGLRLPSPTRRGGGRGAQGHLRWPARREGRLRCQRSPPARGARRGAHRPPPRHRHLRRGRGGGDAVHRHGARLGSHAARRGGRCIRPGGDARRGACRRGPGSRRGAQARALAPRHQAGQ